MVEVAVIGAGAAGLVAARSLLRCGLRACVFESRSHLGGAWSAAAAAAAEATNQQNQHAPTTAHRKNAPPTARPQMWDHLQCNLSQYTCCFSDHPWPEHAPTFPSLANMHEYLDDYASKYVIHDNNCVLHHGCTVTSVDRSSSNSKSESSTSAGQQYTVKWVEEADRGGGDGGAGIQHTKDFDGVIVSTGFFSTPVWPAGLQELAQKHPSRILHSSQYRSPDDGFANQTVAVIGGSFSACEIASDLRRTAQRVVNVLGNRVPYVLPRYIPPPPGQNGGAGFLPLDYLFYRRGDGDVAPKVPETIVLDPDSCRQRHEYLQSLIGPRKRAQASIQGLEFPDKSVFETTPPMVAISDDYLDLVIDGKIQVAPGRMARASETDDVDPGATFDIELEDGTVLPGIDRIIACTGYRSHLDFLAPEILETLQYEESDSFAPLVMCHDTFHPKLPGLGFVGMYRGPYFGVMELQARLLAGLFSKQIDPTGRMMRAGLGRRWKPRSVFESTNRGHSFLTLTTLD